MHNTTATIDDFVDQYIHTHPHDKGTSRVDNAIRRSSIKQMAQNAARYPAK